jgi:hypothetical protein
MIRTILTTIGALLLGMVTFGSLEGLLPLLVSMPPQPIAEEQMSSYINSIPLAGKLLLVVFYAIGTFIAGYLATRFSKPTQLWPAIVISIAFTICGIVNFAILPHPFWLITASLIALAGMPLIGFLVAKPRS